MTSPGLLKRGSITIMTALLAIPLVAMTGASIDLARVWLVKSRLQMSLDAAVLVAAKIIATTPVGTTPNTTDAVNLFWANYNTLHKPDDSWAGILGAPAIRRISPPLPTAP